MSPFVRRGDIITHKEEQFAQNTLKLNEKLKKQKFGNLTVASYAYMAEKISVTLKQQE